ncbi:hypothetical protein B0H67DRAFT_687730 [Lasiosphaeris hirsuta]|uniref:BTB domain-containing protein n=1 Tax=Lasiosphaeris hirsuta TaxID=260670 RepID=A0AA39ZXV0_9PEZI|nr:hypothetical protein B0H67DRAFT_687730 [Lasiosphaeris hirsuta]
MQSTVTSSPSATTTDGKATAEPCSTMLDRYLEAPLRSLEKLSLGGARSSSKIKKAKARKARKYLGDWDKTWDEVKGSGITHSMLFRIYIGPQKREFAIHSALMADQSAAFDQPVNGSFKEARDFHVELDDVDEETLLCFFQYAYTGEYVGEALVHE